MPTGVPGSIERDSLALSGVAIDISLRRLGQLVALVLGELVDELGEPLADLEVGEHAVLVEPVVAAWPTGSSASSTRAPAIPSALRRWSWAQIAP